MRYRLNDEKILNDYPDASRVVFGDKWGIVHSEKVKIIRDSFLGKVLLNDAMVFNDKGKFQFVPATSILIDLFTEKLNESLD